MSKRIYVGNLPVKEDAKQREAAKKAAKAKGGKSVVINHEEQYSAKKDRQRK